MYLNAVFLYSNVVSMHNNIHLLYINNQRFHGVVGYHMCFTYTGSPVRTRVEPFLYKIMQEEEKKKKKKKKKRQDKTRRER